MEKYSEILLFIEKLIKEEKSKNKIHQLFNKKKINWLYNLYYEKLKILEKLIDDE